jgi:hypothetical protein
VWLNSFSVSGVSSIIGSGIYVVMANFSEIEWLRHKAQNALVGADRRDVRSRTACFFLSRFSSNRKKRTNA